MSTSNLYDLFVNSLDMMALRGYCIEPYRELIDTYKYRKALEKDGNTIVDDTDLFSNQKVGTSIRAIMSGTYGYTANSNTAMDNFTYAVTNYTTGHVCFVFFLRNKGDNFLSNHLSDLTVEMGKISNMITGDSDFSKPESFINFVIILKGKIGANPREKIARIKNIDAIHEKTILSMPYDNIMQSQHSIMTLDETEVFQSEEAISSSKLPSISKEKDNLYKYLGAEQKCIDRVHRYKFSDEEILDVSLFYRRIK